MWNLLVRSRSLNPFLAALESEWHSLVSKLKDREDFLGAMRQTPIKPTGEPLADWAPTRFFSGWRSFQCHGRATARFYAAAAPHTRPSVPDHKCLWWGRETCATNLAFARVDPAQQRLQFRHPAEGSG